MIQVYVVCKSEKEARMIAQSAVKERLAACGNFWKCSSVFEWKGKLSKAREAILVLKTTKNKRPALVRKIKSLHSYDVPCICWWSEQADAAYAKWVAQICR